MYCIEKSIGFLLSKAHQRGFAMFKESLDPYGITPQQFALLAFLWKKDHLTQRELTEATLIDRTTMCGLIDRLEKDGLVERQPCPGDRRAYHISLTEKGRSLEGELMPLADVVHARFTSDFTPEELDRLREMLERLRG